MADPDLAAWPSTGNRPAILEPIAAALALHGLMIRGGFQASPSSPGISGLDPAPETNVTILMIGHAGTEMWRHFSASAEFASSAPHPLDSWTKRIVGAVATTFEADLVMPSDGPPYAPFQAWAHLAEGLRQSPLGLLIHPIYGLWHAYRAALVFRKPIPVPSPAIGAAHPCDTCPDRPCLAACPVGAFSSESFDRATCRAHLAGPGSGPCYTTACLARAACPVGSAYRYGPAQARFHTEAFARA